MFYLRWLITGLLLQMPMFDPTPACVGFVVDKLALGLVLLQELGFPLSVSFHQMFNTSSFFSISLSS
jgi:hypothetical protein